MIEFQVPKIVHEEVDEDRGVFVIEPLDRGFGYTFGNSLRRVLLSSLEGAAVTSVKIEGVAHEFTTLPGVREDVTDIILNLKNLICRLHGESPEVEVRLQKKGPGPVKASDIQAPAELEILNPDLEIANLAEKGKLEVTLTIGRGRGYVPGELNRGPEHTIGVIPIDSMFSPVRRVSYDVEAARVGQRTDYDKLRLDITTDGSIDPREAIGQAAEILIRQLAIFTDIEKIEGFGEAAAVADGGVPARAVARARDGELPDRGARARRPLVQLPQAGRHRDDRRPGDEVRERAGRDPELRQEVDRGGQGDARHPRPAAPRRRREQRLRGMRHHRSGRKLGRDASHRKALYANLAGALIEHGRIKTTVTKAKAVRPIAEQMITLGRRGDLHARRQAMAYLRSQQVVHTLFAEVAPRFKDRPGGYSRIVRLGPRPGDAAEMAYLELVDFSAEEQAEEKAERRRLRLRRRQEAEERAEAEAAPAEAPAAS